MPEYLPIRQIDYDIFQVTLPLPFALNSVNCYLIKGANTWTIVDTGINTPEARELWLEVFDALHIHNHAVEKIVLTHFHPDHFGLSGWLQEWTDHTSPVYLSELDKNQAELIWWQKSTKNFADFLKTCDVPQQLTEEILEAQIRTLEMTKPLPSEITILKPGQIIRMGNRTFRMIHTPGHSDGHLIFYDEEDELMLCGDHVLMKITPNIGLWPDTAPDPLHRFLDSLEAIKRLEVRVALPGHKAVIENWQMRTRELIDHHRNRLDNTRQVLLDGPQTIFDISKKIFGDGMFTSHEWRFAMAETYAHLDYLYRYDNVICKGDDVLQFSLTM